MPGFRPMATARAHVSKTYQLMYSRRLHRAERRTGKVGIHYGEIAKDVRCESDEAEWARSLDVRRSRSDLHTMARAC
jgi:hypothetical protein